MKTLIVDNYDSFTYNLVHLFAVASGKEPLVVKNDVPWASIPWEEIDSIVISPGPGSPDKSEDFGICSKIIKECELPILGVCLGFQGICESAGATVSRAPEPMHGRGSPITHTQTGLFEGIPSPFTAIRYHSLAVIDGVPETLRVSARSDDAVVMGVEHISKPIWGIQFHPESICTEFGYKIIENFLRLAKSWHDIDAKNTNDTRFTVSVRKINNLPDPELIFSEFFADSKYTFWLDSALSVADEKSRFSVLGDASGPLAEVIKYDVLNGELTTTLRGHDNVIRTSLFEYLKRRCAQMAPVNTHGLEFEFELGFVGFLGYEMKAETGGTFVHRSPYPDAAFIFADRAIVHDARDGSGWLLELKATNGLCDADPVPSWLDDMSHRLKELSERARSDRRTPPHRTCVGGEVKMRHDRDAYLTKIESAMELIRAGETYELCLTNEGTAITDVDPVTLYEQMRRRSPVPFGAFFRTGELAVLSASPERFISVSSRGAVESRPIKGTRARHMDPAQDERVREELQSSDKDRAENLMIVDLVRNDLAQVCEFGSVHVPQLFEVETFSTVHQLVSTVVGTLRSDQTSVDAVKAAFPGGSMTGAPKVRTMELIDSLEGGARGVYSGALGWFSLTGACDLSIVIRTITMIGPKATFGTGGAIIALSDPDDEWNEIEVKSSVMRSLLEAPGE